MSLLARRAVDGGRRWSRRVRALVRAQAVILEYHRVAEYDTDPYRLAVTPSHFSEHLGILRRLGPVLPLRRALDALMARTLPRRAIVVTLDDGYADSLHAARPLLERHDVPATVFVTSGGIGGRREFWWDQLERIAEHPGPLGASLTLTTAHGTCSVDVAVAPSNRQRLLQVLQETLAGRTAGERSDLLARLTAELGLDPTPRPTHRPLTVDELGRLADGGLVEIGAHTVTHPVLAQLGSDAQRREIEQSKTDLETLLGTPVVTFAYPHGTATDYTPETVRLVRRTGFRGACSSIYGAVRRDSDLFQLPRLPVLDCDGDGLSERVSELFRGAGA
jgi:peptidoglycan/xylan/chitin deacetylase (PgdA/CDA1 family)